MNEAIENTPSHKRIHKWDLMVILPAAPFSDESVSTALRFIDATASSGGRVLVWACGFATWLTQAGQPATKPSNAMDWSMDCPSPQRSVGDLLKRNAKTLTWVACRFCSEERNFVNHLPAVRMKLAMQMASCSKQALKTVTVGLT